MESDKDQILLIAIAWIGHKIDDENPKFDRISKEFGFEKKVVSSDGSEMRQHYPLTKGGEPVCINELAHQICQSTEYTQVLYFEDW